VSTYVRRLTRSGDLVVDLFCQGPAVVRETVTAGRRALGLSVNPVLLVAARMGLGHPEVDALNAAFTRLADSLKGDVPLHRYMDSLYHSACPTCGAPGTAAWLAWDRDGDYPFEKAVRCPRCEGVQEGAPDDADVESARRVPPRALAYHYALNRVAPSDHPARGRAAELVELYTPRNLSALMDLAMRLEGLETDDETQLALTGALLDCFDAGSSLDPPAQTPHGEERTRPRTLRVPPRYLERNVWLCFEERVLNLVHRLEAGDRPPRLPQAEESAALARGEAQGYGLVGRAARDVGQVIPPGSAALIFADPPRPDAVFWALSALWAGWLWESPAARRLRPFLRRRRFGWEWHWRVLGAALQAAGPLLTPTGRLITLFTEPQGVNGGSDVLLESTCLATSDAGYTLEGWGYEPETGYQMTWRWTGTEPAPPADAKVLGRHLRATAGQRLVDTLRKRGEPTGWALLHGSAYVELVERGLLRRATAVPKETKEAKENSPPALAFTADAVRHAFESAPLIWLTDSEGKKRELGWLADPGGAGEPLADRVGTLVWELLAKRRTWEREKLVDAVYAQFPGALTPDLKLVEMCADSYSVQEGATLHLRPEDNPLQRAAEIEVTRDDLAELGRRLGFHVRRGGGWDVCWLEEGRETYAFAISATVALGPYLLTRRPVDEGAQRCLIVPGGRAGLVDLKLQRDPRLAQAVDADEWQFIKFRHLRRLLQEEDLDRHALKTVLGLDPIVEREAAQIPLF